jgi:hypothetical protein
MLAQTELFRTELLTARVTPAHFKYPVVWADLDETPAVLKEILGRLLMSGSTAR